VCIDEAEVEANRRVLVAEPRSTEVCTEGGGRLLENLPYLHDLPHGKE